MNTKAYVITIATVLFVATFGIVLYKGGIVEKKSEPAAVSPSPSVSKIINKNRAGYYAGLPNDDLITDGERTVVKSSLPEAAEEFVRELDAINREIARDLDPVGLKKDPEQDFPSLDDDPDLEKIITSGEELIKQMDEKHNLGTAEFISGMLDTVPNIKDPELDELSDKIDKLDEEMDEIMRSLQ